MRAQTPGGATVARRQHAPGDLAALAGSLAGFHWSALLLAGSGVPRLHRAARSWGEAIDGYEDADLGPGADDALIRAGVFLMQRAVAMGRPVVTAPAGPLGLGAVGRHRSPGTADVVGVLLSSSDVMGILLGGVGPGETSRAGRPDRWRACGALLTAAVARSRHAHPGDERRRLVSGNRQLAAEVVMRRRLALALGTGDLQAMVDAVVEVVASPSAFVDARGRVVACSPPRAGARFASASSALAGSGGADAAQSSLLVGLADPAGDIVAVAVRAGEDHAGWLLVAGPSDDAARSLTALISLAGDRVGRAFVVEARISGGAWDPRAELARQLIRSGPSAEALHRAGSFLGVDASADRVLAYVLPPPAAQPTAADGTFLIEATEHLLGTEVLAVRGPEAVLLLVAAPDTHDGAGFEERVVDAVRRAVGRRWQGAGAVVGVSSVHEASALRRAYRDARDAARCVRNARAGGDDLVVRSADLGPAQLFLANTQGSAALRYARDVLGPLLATSDGHEDLLRTLQAYTVAGCSVRASAARLGLHENTVRLRLERVNEATGIDVVRDRAQRLMVETALLVLRLQGHPALTPIGRRDAAPLQALPA